MVFYIIRAAHQLEISYILLISDQCVRYDHDSYLQHPNIYQQSQAWLRGFILAHQKIGYIVRWSVCISFPVKDEQTSCIPSSKGASCTIYMSGIRPTRQRHSQSRQTHQMASKVKHDVGRIDRSTPYPLVRPFLGRQPVPDVDYFVHRPNLTKDSVENHSRFLGDDPSKRDPLVQPFQQLPRLPSRQPVRKRQPFL